MAGSSASSDAAAPSDGTAPARARPRRWPVVALAAVLGTAGLLIAQATIGNGQPVAGPSPIVTPAWIRLLPPNGTAAPPGTGPFSGSGNSLKPFVTHGPGRSLVIVIEGSGSCPQIATNVRLTGPQQLVVDQIQLPLFGDADYCTADLAPHWTTLQLPTAADEHRPLHVIVDDRPIDLPPR